MSAAEFQRWGQRVVYHSAGAGTHDLGQSQRIYHDDCRQGVGPDPRPHGAGGGGGRVDRWLGARNHIGAFSENWNAVHGELKALA